MVVREIPVNPTPAEEKAILDAGVAFVMGDPPPKATKHLASACACCAAGECVEADMAKCPCWPEKRFT